jgi:hypothetical protein
VSGGEEAYVDLRLGPVKKFLDLFSFFGYAGNQTQDFTCTRQML